MSCFWSEINFTKHFIQPNVLFFFSYEIVFRDSFIFNLTILLSLYFPLP